MSRLVAAAALNATGHVQVIALGGPSFCYHRCWEIWASKASTSDIITSLHLLLLVAFPGGTGTPLAL